MKAADMRSKSIAELESLLAEKKTELANSQRSLAASELPNPRVVRVIRKDIARINTLLTEKNSSESSKGEA
tara:strand:- start:339 stop:551 length:213 start_codon:yes stop_codon:yes gene_type:complete